MFDSIYGQAKITAKYLPENEAVKMLIDDSLEVVILSRNLNKEELAFFEARQLIPKWNRLAVDALAFVLHPSNRDSVLTVEQVKNILSGKISTWKEINPKSSLGPISIVFDNPNSGIVRFVKDSILVGGELSKQVFAVKNNPEVIKYVGEHPGSIGLIGLNWISDTDDKGVQKFRKAIRVAEIAKTAGVESFKPMQAYLATHDYPFRRSIYIINAQGRTFGLGTGISSFLASQRGQLIFLKSGLLPANSPIRLVETRKSL